MSLRHRHQKFLQLVWYCRFFVVLLYCPNDKKKMKNQKIANLISEMLMTAKGKQSKALKVTEIRNAFAKLNEIDKAKFTASLVLAQDLAKLKPLFDEFCKAVKNKLKDEGFTAKEMPNQDAIIWEVYKITKSWFHRLVKVGSIDKPIVNKFIAKCDEMEANGETPTRSIDALNTWAKSYDDHKGEADTDGESLSDLRGGKERRETDWVIKKGKLKLTFFSDGTSETNFTDSELEGLLVEITAHIKTKYTTAKNLTKKDREKLDVMQRAKKPTAVNKLLK